MEYIEGTESNSSFVDANDVTTKKYSLAEYFDYEYLAEENMNTSMEKLWQWVMQANGIMLLYLI